MSIRSVLENIQPDENLIKNTEMLLKSKDSQKKFHLNKLLIAACLSIILVTLTFSTYRYNQPVAYICIDVNPSLELVLNKFDRVIDVVYFNDEAKNLVSIKEIHSLKPAEAINLILDKVSSRGYLSSSSDSVVSIAMYSNNVDRSIQLMEESIKDVDYNFKSINIVSYTVSTDLKKEADSLSISFGKLNLIKIIQHLDKSVAVEDYRDVSITSIMNDILYLVSDENTNVDDKTKESIKDYINSIQVNENRGIHIGKEYVQDDNSDQAVDDSQKVSDEVPSTQKFQKEDEKISNTTEPFVVQQPVKVEKEESESQVQAAQESAKTEKEKAESEALVAQEAAKAEKEKVESEALAAQEAGKAEKEKAESEALAAQEAAKVEKEKVEAEALVEQEAAKAEKEKAEAEALAAQEAAKAEKEKAEAEILAAQEAAKAEKEKAEAEAQAALEAAKAEKEKAESEALAAQEAAKVEKEKAEAEAQAAQEAAKAEKEKAEAEAQAAQEAAKAEKEKAEAEALAAQEVAKAEKERAEAEKQ